MTTARYRVVARLGLFSAELVVVFGLAFGVGRAVGPDEDTPVPMTTTSTVPVHDDMEMGS